MSPPRSSRRRGSDRGAPDGGASNRERPERISTVHLGQYTRETANAIAEEFEKAGIVWWYKEPGWMAVVWEFGVRLFVDKKRLADAKEIAARVTAEREAARQAGLEPGPSEPGQGTRR